MGASVNLVTKSGTNSLRGQVYEWYRGSTLDANNFFDNRAGRPKRDYMDNRFGVAVGGPVVRNRTFYFANVEVNPFEVPSPIIVTVPTEKDAQRRFLGAARARPAVSDLRSGDDPPASDAGRPLHARSVPGQHHSAEPPRSDRAQDPRILSPAQSAGHGRRHEQLLEPDGVVAGDVLYGDDPRGSQPVRSSSHLRPLQLGLLGRREGRPLRQPRDRHLPQPQESRLRD